MNKTSPNCEVMIGNDFLLCHVMTTTLIHVLYGANGGIAYDSGEPMEG